MKTMIRNNCDHNVAAVGTRRGCRHRSDNRVNTLERRVVPVGDANETTVKPMCYVTRLGTGAIAAMTLRPWGQHGAK